jgi:hypothetical protein
VKAIEYVKENYPLGECEIVFRLVALSHSTGGYRAGFPECDRKRPDGHARPLCGCDTGSM